MGDLSHLWQGLSCFFYFWPWFDLDDLDQGHWPSGFQMAISALVYLPSFIKFWLELSKLSLGQMDIRMDGHTDGHMGLTTLINYDNSVAVDNDARQTGEWVCASWQWQVHKVSIFSGKFSIPPLDFACQGAMGTSGNHTQGILYMATFHLIPNYFTRNKIFLKNGNPKLFLYQTYGCFFKSNLFEEYFLFFSRIFFLKLRKYFWNSNTILNQIN